MQDGTFDLLKRRRFLPLFIAQCLGAVNDNLFKNALVILVIFRLGGEGSQAQILVTVAAGLLILPFFLFSATAGQLSDRYEKSALIKLIKLAEIPIVALAGGALYVGNTWLMLIVLFLLGTQATMFGPLKYAILPEQLHKDELVEGNALIEGGTFLCILIGTVVGGLVILTDGGIGRVTALMVVLAAIGFVASLFQPKAHPGNETVRIGTNIFRETINVMGDLGGQRDLFLSVLGISWFWLVGATFLAQFPTFAKDFLHADEHMVTLMLATFSVGIGIGSMVCGRMLKGEISARHVPFAALGITLFSLDLSWAGGAIHGASASIAPLGEILRNPSMWRVLVDLLLISICGGIYIVPLYTILQSRSDESHRARVIAANNIMNALFMVFSAGATAVMLAVGFDVIDVFLSVALANLAVAVYICGLLPEMFLKGVLSWFLRLFYRVRIEGFENVQKAGERVVVVVNHVSFLDPVLLAAFLPGKPSFAINTQIAKRWWVRPFLNIVKAIPVDPTKPLATKSMVHAVRDGGTCVIFPEGRITVTGALMKIYEGPGLIADRARANILPIRIDGAQYTPFSRLRGKIRLRWFPQITITILPPRQFHIPDTLKGRARRRLIGLELYDIMSAMMFETSDHKRTLFEALLDTRKANGGRALAAEDIARKPLTYNGFLMASLALGRPLTHLSQVGEAVGLLLPNAIATAVTFFALQATGHVPAMLNFTTGANNVLSACKAARIATVVTSRQFIDQARLGSLIDALNGKVNLVFLEDLRQQIGLRDKILSFLSLPLALGLHRRFRRRPQDAAVILFTSGSEGTPKGVVLSHLNLLANCHQIAARVAFGPTDIVFNALPVFHSFGLTGGLLLPLLSGIKTFLYPSPLHYRIVPELVYDTNATIMFGTDTFLAGYAKTASPYDFYSMHYVFAGAEKVKDETRKTWMDKFGVRILEGYGATETSPVIATNTPMHYRAGTVGRILPGIEHKLESIPGIDGGKRLIVRGPNVMLGYFRAEHPGELEPPKEGWYDTGDIVVLEEGGYVRIVGRAKRFAKIAGEMVSLGQVEAAIAELWPENHHAVVAIDDQRKGEQLIALTDKPDASREALLPHFRSKGMAEILVPRTIMKVDHMPLLGTGKTDYVAVKKLAESFAHDGDKAGERGAV